MTTPTAPPPIALAAGLAALHANDLGAAHEALTRAAELNPADPAPWVALAQLAERQGDLALTLKHTLHAVNLDSRQAPVLLAVGRGLQSVNRLDDAECAFQAAAEAQPEAVDGWQALASLLLARQRPVRAMRALEHALKLAPGHSDLHGLAGDILLAGDRFEGAAKAYGHALLLYPKSGDWLNKLGCVQKQLGDLSGAEATFRRAVVVAPTTRPARENLAVMFVEQERIAEARAVLRDGLKVPDLDPEARRNAIAVLTIFAEHDLLAPIIAQAVILADDSGLAKVIGARGAGVLTVDQPRVELLRTLSMKTGGPVRAREHDQFARGLPVWAGWPAFEAHFALHGGDDIDAALATVRSLAENSAGLQPGNALARRKVWHFTRAITLRRAMPSAANTGAAAEARLRFWHAVITQDDRDVFPGQVKPLPNLVSSNPGVIRTPLDAVPGTWRVLLTEHRDRAQPGPWRAALLYFAIVDIHGFRNANGRLARFMMNVELEAAGFHPIVHTDAIVKSVAAALSAVRHLEDLEPLVDLFARASADTARLVAAVQARELSPQ